MATRHCWRSLSGLRSECLYGASAIFGPKLLVRSVMPITKTRDMCHGQRGDYQTKVDREILSFDVSDELLERAANAEQSGFTVAFCTSYWDSCGLPAVAR